MTQWNRSARNRATNRIEREPQMVVHSRPLTFRYLSNPVYVFSTFNRLESNKVQLCVQPSNCFRQLAVSWRSFRTFAFCETYKHVRISIASVNGLTIRETTWERHKHFFHFLARVRRNCFPKRLQNQAILHGNKSNQNLIIAIFTRISVELF